MQRKNQEATAYINFSLAMEMKLMQSIGWSIHLLCHSFEHTSVISDRRLHISKVLICQQVLWVPPEERSKIISAGRERYFWQSCSLWEALCCPPQYMLPFVLQGRAGNAGRQFGTSSLCTGEEEWVLELEVLIGKKPILISCTAHK